MSKAGGYTISNIYQGGYSSFKPYNTEATAGSMGLTTDARSANILKEVSDRLSTGVKHIEVSAISPDMIDQIPKQQMEEVRRLKELIGIEVSMHGPVIDTTGITQQGFSELNRENSEKTIIHTLNRSHELDPKGNIVVTFHSVEGIPGTEWKQIPERDKKGEAKKLIVVNRESGKLAPLEEERKFYPEMRELRPEIQEKIDKRLITQEELGKKKLEELYSITPVGEGKIYTPEKELKVLNDSEWINNITSLENFKKQADEVMAGAIPVLAPIFSEYKEGEKFELTPPQKDAINKLERAEIFLSNVESGFNAMYNKAYKFSNDKEKEKLNEISKQWVKNSREMEKNANRMNMPILKSQLLEKAIAQIRDVRAPEMYIPVEKFAVEQSSKTFGNAAFASWEKFKDSAPIVSIENPPAGFALSTGEDLKNLTEASRKQFVKNAVESGKLSEQEAKKQAEKLIGTTWDVGHINMLRKQGFEEKDIVKETEKIAPYLKHIHLSDNFGMEHTELPMGMGNVPIKEIMGKLGKKGFEAKKVIEAIHWYQHQKTPVLQQTMEAMGSPIYSDSVGPYWNQSLGFQQDYYSGYGMMLPSVHYNMQGSGFSMASLPTELGGQMPGAQGSRMSGRGME